MKNLLYPQPVLKTKLDSNLEVSMRRRSRIGAMAAFCVLLSGFPASAQEVSPDVHHDVSGPLQSMSRPPLAGPKHEKPLFRLDRPTSNQPDPVVQTSAGPLIATTNGL